MPLARCSSSVSFSLGHNNKAVLRAYARKLGVKLSVAGGLREARGRWTNHPVAISFVGDALARTRLAASRLTPFVPAAGCPETACLRAFFSRQCSRITSLARASHFSSRRSASKVSVANLRCTGTSAPALTKRGITCAIAVSWPSGHLQKRSLQEGFCKKSCEAA